jgi:hypothetical protein
MRVKFNVAVSDGEGTTYRSGRSYDLEQAEADHWVGLGFAEVVDGPKPRAAKAVGKKAAAKRPAKKAAAKKTAVNPPPSTAEQKD